MRDPEARLDPRPASLSAASAASRSRHPVHRAPARPPPGGRRACRRGPASVSFTCATRVPKASIANTGSAPSTSVKKREVARPRRGSACRRSRAPRRGDAGSHLRRPGTLAARAAPCQAVGRMHREPITGLPPGPRLPRWMQTAGFIFQPSRFIDGCRRRYGDVVTFRSLFDPCFVMVFDPEIAQAGVPRLARPAARRRGQRRARPGGGRSARCCCSTAPSTCASASCCCRRSTASGCAPTSAS